jgi:ubiquinone/menaquinone biosynthesis C-methylase UbiE
LALRASSVDGWNHNSHYHGVLLSTVPRPCARALDVGCGLGSFVRQLARIARHVDAIDRDAMILEQARKLSGGITNLNFVEADFLTWKPERSYDFVSFIATLHHLPFKEAITKAAGLLRPGGVVAVLGLDRPASWFEAGLRSVVAYPVSGYHRLTRHFTPVGAPTVEPDMTLGEIRRQAAALLPGAVVRRHLLWRYSLLWINPGIGP